MVAMPVIVSTALLTTVLIALFVIVTDGRYFGKPLVHWMYDAIGPTVFGSQSEVAQWRDLAHELDTERFRRTMDLGTALGDLPISMLDPASAVGFAVGVDRSMPMLRAAKQRAADAGVADRVAFVLADVTAPLPFDASVFTLASALGVLETLPRPARVLEEMVRVLGAEGTILVSVYRGRASWLATLRESWYREALGLLGLPYIRRVTCRKSHDVLIAERSLLPMQLDHRS